MDVFFVAVFLFLSGCHILIEKSAIFITKMQFLSLEDITLQFLKKTGKKKEKLLKTTKMLHYLFTYFVSQNRTNFLQACFNRSFQTPNLSWVINITQL
jgi:hypothetical protein